MDPRIAWAVGEMQRRLAEPLRVRDLAAPVNLSPSRFAHLFRGETGIPPAQYLHALRMDRARSLLESTSLPVRTVMRVVGCRDPSHFARDFRRLHGVSPRELRWASRATSGRRRVPTQIDGPQVAQDSTDRSRKSGDNE